MKSYILDYGELEKKPFSYDTFYVVIPEGPKIIEFDTLAQGLLWASNHNVVCDVTNEAREMDKLLRDEETEKYFSKRTDKLNIHMLAQISDNHHKVLWSEVPEAALIAELDKNYNKLSELLNAELSNENANEQIIRRSANIANFLVMILDNRNLLNH